MAHPAPVKIGPHEFTSGKEAVGYFTEQYEKMELGVLITEGALFETLKALYARYRDLIPGMESDDRLISGFAVPHPQRIAGGLPVSHPSFIVLLSSGEFLLFSAKEATEAFVSTSVPGAPASDYR